VSAQTKNRPSRAAARKTRSRHHRQVAMSRDLARDTARGAIDRLLPGPVQAGSLNRPPPLFHTVCCPRGELPKLEAHVRATSPSARYFVLMLREPRPVRCCGRTAWFVSTAPFCDGGDRCQVDHRVMPERAAAELAKLLRCDLFIALRESDQGGGGPDGGQPAAAAAA